jgi:hypothetical protein
MKNNKDEIKIIYLLLKPKFYLKIKKLNLFIFIFNFFFF